MNQKTSYSHRVAPASVRVECRRYIPTLAAALCLSLAGCSGNVRKPGDSALPTTLTFAPQQTLGQVEYNPAIPFLRYSRDGRLFAIWTEDDGSATSKADHSQTQHHQSGKMAPSPMRNALLSFSNDGGKTWSSPKRVNRSVEAVQGEENGPKVAFNAAGQANVVWSIPGGKGDKTRANIRFAMEDGKGGFTSPRTLNEVKDAARFPIIEFTPDGTLLVAWIDRRIDNPKPRQLYLVRLGQAGKALTKNYSVGEGLCECCKLGVAFADNGKTVYMVDRQVDEQKVRNHVLRKSTDGGKSFGAPVEISNDGWAVPSCPHSGPSIGRDSRGWLHVTWFTLGRSEEEAGIYYSVSNDEGKSFALRQQVHANSAPEILYSTLAVGDDDTVYLAWSNLDSDGKGQIFTRTLRADGQTWGPIQQVSRAKGNASRPALAVAKNQLHIAWTEIDGEDSRVILRNATVVK